MRRKARRARLLETRRRGSHLSDEPVRSIARAPAYLIGGTPELPFNARVRVGDGVGPIKATIAEAKRRVLLSLSPTDFCTETRDAHALREGPRARIRHCQEVLDVIDQDGVCAGKLGVPRLFDKKQEPRSTRRTFECPTPTEALTGKSGEDVAPERVRAGVVRHLPDEFCAVVGDAKVTDGGVVASSAREDSTPVSWPSRPRNSPPRRTRGAASTKPRAPRDEDAHPRRDEASSTVRWSRRRKGAGRCGVGGAGWRPCLPVEGRRLFNTELGNNNCPLFCLALTECLDRSVQPSFDGSLRSCRRSRYSPQVVPSDMFVVCLPSSETTRRAHRPRLRDWSERALAHSRPRAEARGGINRKG